MRPAARAIIVTIVAVADLPTLCSSSSPFHPTHRLHGFHDISLMQHPGGEIDTNARPDARSSLLLLPLLLLLIFTREIDQLGSVDFDWSW
jgi:hypothetical protein